MAGAPEEERVLDHHRRVRVGEVRELEQRRDVAGGEDPRDWWCAAAGRPGLPVLSYATPAASSPSSSTLGARPTATRISSHAVSPPLAAALPDDDALAAGCATGAAHLDHLRAERELDAVAHQRVLHDLRGVGVLADQDLRRHVEERDARAEARERLRQLAADRSRADRPPGAAAARSARTRSRWCGSPPARGPGSAAPRRARRSRSRRGGSAASLPSTSTESRPVKRPCPRKTSTPTLVRRAAPSIGLICARSRRMRSIAAAKSPPALRPRRAERGARRARRARRAPARMTRLRRHAADVEAVAAEQMALDQRDLGAEPGRADRAHQAGGAGADHHQVIAVLRRRVAPVRRMDVLDQPPVVLVERLDQRLARVSSFIARAVFTRGSTSCPPSARASCSSAALLLSARDAMRVTTVVTTSGRQQPEPEHDVVRGAALGRGAAPRAPPRRPPPCRSTRRAGCRAACRSRRARSRPGARG